MALYCRCLHLYYPKLGFLYLRDDGVVFILTSNVLAYFINPYRSVVFLEADFSGKTASYPETFRFCGRSRPGPGLFHLWRPFPGLSFHYLA